MTPEEHELLPSGTATIVESVRCTMTMSAPGPETDTIL
jgi:hypothetical protein